MQPHCFGRKNKEEDCQCIVGYFTIWEHNSKTHKGEQLPIQNAKLLKHHKTTKTTMAEQTPRSTGTAAQQHAERVAEIFRRMRAVGQQQTERASGK